MPVYRRRSFVRAIRILPSLVMRFYVVIARLTVVLIDQDVEFSPIDVDNLLNADVHLETQAVKIHLSHFALSIYNVYVPPASSCAPGYVPDFDKLLDHADGEAVIVGNFNAHGDSWFSASVDVRGDLLVDSVESSDFAFLNTDSPTRVPSNGSPSSPDVSLASAHLLRHLLWSVPQVLNGSFSSPPLNSDHLSILVSFVDPLHQNNFNTIHTQR